jgi:hypothetical protein
MKEPCRWRVRVARAKVVAVCQCALLARSRARLLGLLGRRAAPTSKRLSATRELNPAPSTRSRVPERGGPIEGEAHARTSDTREEMG